MTPSDKVCVVTGSRADYGLLTGIMEILASRDALQLLVTGSHLEASSQTESEIIADGFFVDQRVPLPSTGRNDLETAIAVGTGTTAIAEALHSLRPGIVLILGDRFEAFSAAQAAFFLNLPVAHLHGGEVTTGSLDDSTRHAISKLSRWHFAANADARDRLIRMGEDPASIFVTGSPGLDRVRTLEPLDPDALARDLGWAGHAPFFLVTYHPVTNDQDETDAGIHALIDALGEQDGRIVITGANADAGGTALNRSLAAFAEAAGDRVRVRSSLGRHRYLSAMRHCIAVVGNSSSGIVEAPFLGKPTINIGSRQDGRPAAASVVQAKPTAESIRDAFAIVSDREFQAKVRSVETLYGDGFSSKRVAEQLFTLLREPSPGAKRFHDA